MGRSEIVNFHVAIHPTSIEGLENLLAQSVYDEELDAEFSREHGVLPDPVDQVADRLFRRQTASLAKGHICFVEPSSVPAHSTVFHDLNSYFSQNSPRLGRLLF